MRRRAALFIIFSVLWFIAAIGLIGLAGAGRTGSAIVAGLAFLSWLLAAIALRPVPGIDMDEGGGAMQASPDLWLQAEDGRLAVARLTRYGAAMSPLTVLLHLRFIRRGTEGVAQVGMTAGEARDLAAGLLRMAERLDAVPVGTIH